MENHEKIMDFFLPKSVGTLPWMCFILKRILFIDYLVIVICMLYLFSLLFFNPLKAGYLDQG